MKWACKTHEKVRNLGGGIFISTLHLIGQLEKKRASFNNSNLVGN